jgi:hypothetical protein
MAGRSSLYFDETRDAVVDGDSGAVIPLDLLVETDQLPNDVRLQIQTKRDADLAKRLANEYQGTSVGRPNLLGGDYYPLGPETRASSQRSGGKSLEQEYMELQSRPPTAPSAPPGEEPTDGPASDWSLANALQAFEFEIVDDTYHDPRSEDFNEKEYRASSCKRQLLTLSTFICVIQVASLSLINISASDIQTDRTACCYGPR